MAEKSLNSKIEELDGKVEWFYSDEFKLEEAAKEAGVRYHVEVYNKALGAEIDYKTGEVLGEEGIHSNDKRLYVINTNTGKFHYPSCNSAKTMAEKNRKEVKAARADLIKEGYEPCGSCEP